MLMQTKQVFPQAKDFNTAVEVDNYPWGYTLKTKRKYWIETKKGFGDRFVYCTMNPKTGKWCKPKAGTYFTAGVVTQDPNGYVKYDACTGGYGNENIAEFVDKYWEMLTDTQKAEICKVNAWNEVMEKVKVKIVNVTGWTKEEKAEFDAKQEKAKGQIAGAAYAKTAACITKNNLEVK